MPFSSTARLGKPPIPADRLSFFWIVVIASGKHGFCRLGRSWDFPANSGEPILLLSPHPTIDRLSYLMI